MFNLFTSPRLLWNISAVCVVFLASLLLTGYTDITSTSSAYATDTLEFGSFVEPSFPYIPAAIDARKLGAGFPDDNQAARTLAVKLGDSAYVCFDTDRLRWSVAWTGKFLPMVSMAQVSYKDFFNKNNSISTLTGVPKIATGLYPGWSNHKSDYSNITSKQPEWGPIPAEKGRWKGVYVHGDKAIFNYSVGRTNVFEMPGSARLEDQVIFTRTIRMNGPSEDLYLTAAEVRGASASERRGGITYVYHGAGKDTVTAIGILGKGNIDWQTEADGNRYLTVKIPAGAAREATVAIWKGPSKKRSVFEKFCKKTHITFPDFTAGGPAPWKETVLTQGELSPDTAAFVTDRLTLPLHNSWKRNVRVADIAFFRDGRAAVVTFEGDVWTIDGISSGLQNLKWRRIASGLHEPMSVEIVNERVYVFGREGIVLLRDLNGDGVTDFYENFSNIMPQSSESREWAADMVTAPDGGFYIAKGGSLSNGPGVTAPVAKGFRAGSSLSGTILKIAPDGLKYEVIATGLRGPYLGINARTGMLTASDQQGNFVPSTPIYLIKKGDYYGVEPTRHRNDNPSVAPPLTWIPHSVDRSSISQAWVTSTKMGPLNGNLIHFSFGHPGLFRVLIDSTSQVIQGGVSFIQAAYPAPTSKGAMNPLDEQLYVAGFNLWGSSSNGLSALLRLRYTGKPSYMPNLFRAGKQGIILGFDSELKAEEATAVSSFLVKRWDYKRTEEYGSGHFKTDGTPGEETIPVAASYLSADRKKVLLLIPEMTEVMQMEVSYRLLAKDGHQINDQFWFTVNKVGELRLAQEGFEDVNLALLTAPKQEAAPSAKNGELVTVQRGKELFQRMACSGCHSEGLRTKGMYGPPFQGMYNSERLFDDGTKTIADEKYLRESILTPSLKIVKGYNEEMPSFAGVLSDPDIESIILYIKSLSGK
ncbi:hypothetical protein DYBT9275_06070 [Dyadobacter sp. CECT 9275]|uniref:Cytochrome c domain-containing protein n=1 Tax=Dyadobacter helix TaxID=2822344 RepID=A0A916JJB4_9BACT|nr:DUF6797 domain-containing protein [Dyadobacter sp. CECT 9275]CAG5018781.1 hypothetical protein DYBT9275_06070 [Dyadobacter sp. CECT 9275]